MGEISNWYQMSRLRWLQIELCHCILAEDAAWEPSADQQANSSFRQSTNVISLVCSEEYMKISAWEPAGNAHFYKREFIAELLKGSAEFRTDPSVRNDAAWNMPQKQLLQDSSQKRDRLKRLRSSLRNTGQKKWALSERAFFPKKQQT